MTLDDAGNYRGITFLMNNTLATIYSQLLLNRLTDWSEKHDKLWKKKQTNKKNSLVFQIGKSVVGCVFILHSVISKVLIAGEKLFCVFIDYEKCFDKIDRSFLYGKNTFQKSF